MSSRLYKGTFKRDKDAALTLGLAVQPEIVSDIATMPGFRGKGLLGRILYALPVSNIGYRNLEPAPIPAEVLATYDRNLRALLATMYGWEDPVRLTFSPEAAQTFLEHRRRTEPRLRANGGDLGHMTDWGSKYDGAVARISGLIHLATDVTNAWRYPISGDTMRAAIRLGELPALTPTPA